MNSFDRRARISQTTVLLALSLAAGGCATVLHGTRQTVEVFTDPPGATATAGDQTVTTPGVLRLPRKVKQTQIRIEKEGFAPKTVVLERRTSGLVWLNFIGVPVGVIGGASAGSATSNDSLGGLDQAATGAWVVGAALPTIGFLTDFGNGAAYRLDPARVVVRLELATSSASKQSP